MPHLPGGPIIALTFRLLLLVSSAAEIVIVALLANIRLKGDLHAPKGGAADAMAADKPVINPFRAPGISVIGLPAAHTRDIIIGSLARICYPSFSSFSLVSFLSSGATPPPFLPPPLLLPRGPSASVVRASALIMRGFRRSRFHSFLRLRHREMIIGT